ncbi:EamA family transporter [Streptomyces montanisoli]|uniref:EamA family transporter n=1 Tax=Streptomyces montanisoli TaxID=2798581 RepID=A0A940S085_9ACTN|nr:EamA family transporter [Streptomyces montanisoli]MBP0460599.1 EamA family transporter [Streptomyces montanisoli]
MTPLVALAVLVAAVTHAGWNAIAHDITDKLVAFTLISGGGAVIGALLLCVAPLPHAGAWPYLAVSAVVHVAYYLLLMRSFSLGDFGQVYPIARGTAPLVVTVVAAAVLSESLNGWQAAGVCASSAGLIAMALWGIRGRGAPPRGAAIRAALATGLSIAAYTVVDGVGVRRSGTPIGYLAWLMVLEGLLIPAYAVYVRRGRLAAELRPRAALGLLGAALSLTAYGLVLWAQTRADLAPVAALRESSVIVGAAIGTVVFKERFGAPRIAAAGLVVAGTALLLHSG